MPRGRSFDYPSLTPLFVVGGFLGMGALILLPFEAGAVAALAVSGGTTLIVLARLRQSRDEWIALGAVLGLHPAKSRLLGLPPLRGRVNGWDVEMRANYAPDQGVARELVVAIPALEPGFHLGITREAPLLAAYLGPDAVLGNPRFDAAFHLFVSDNAAAREVLTPEVQADLLALRSFGGVIVKDARAKYVRSTLEFDPAEASLELRALLGIAAAAAAAREPAPWEPSPSPPQQT